MRRHPVHGVQHHRPAPHAPDVLEHLAPPVLIDATAIGEVVVLQFQGAIIAQLRHRDIRRAEIVLRREQRLVQAMQVGIHHFDLPIGATGEAEQFQLIGNLAGQVIAHEAEVIIFLS